MMLLLLCYVVNDEEDDGDAIGIGGGDVVIVFCLSVYTTC